MATAEAELRNRLARLVREPSVSCVDAALDMSNAGVGDCIADWFDGAGFEVTRQTVTEAPEKINVIARAGSGAGGLVLSGHLDTVPYDTERWDTDPFELVERDGRWYGLGSADMKCFFPAVLAALEGLDRRRLVRPLTALGTADEESSMDGARALRSAGIPLGDFAVIGEPTNLVPIHKHKGILIGRIDVTGRSGHSSNPALGANAIDGMHAVIGSLMQWREEAAERHRDGDFAVPVPTLNLGRIAGGDSPNRICPSCELLFDVRTMPSMEMATITRELSELVSAALEGSGLSGELSLPMEPLAPMETPPGSAIVAAAERLTGNPARTVAFATEGPFLNELGCETVVLGPGDIDTAHQPNEFVPVDNMLRMVGILRSMIEQFCCDG